MKSTLAFAIVAAAFSVSIHSASASAYPQCFTGKAGDTLCVTIKDGRIRTDRVDRLGRTKSGNDAPRPKPKRVVFRGKGAPTTTQGTGR